MHLIYALLKMIAFFNIILILLGFLAHAVQIITLKYHTLEVIMLVVFNLNQN